MALFAARVAVVAALLSAPARLASASPLPPAEMVAGKTSTAHLMETLTEVSVSLHDAEGFHAGGRAATTGGPRRAQARASTAHFESVLVVAAAALYVLLAYVVVSRKRSLEAVAPPRSIRRPFFASPAAWAAATRLPSPPAPRRPSLAEATPAATKSPSFTLTLTPLAATARSVFSTVFCRTPQAPRVRQRLPSILKVPSSPSRKSSGEWPAPAPKHVRFAGEAR
eukprot:EG_transcript_26472